MKSAYDVRGPSLLDLALPGRAGDRLLGLLAARLGVLAAALERAALVRAARAAALDPRHHADELDRPRLGAVELAGHRPEPAPVAARLVGERQARRRGRRVVG